MEWKDEYGVLKVGPIPPRILPHRSGKMKEWGNGSLP